MNLIDRHTKETAEIELEDEELKAMSILCELAKRYIELKKQGEGDYCSWVPGEVIVDEYKSEDIKQVLSLVISLEVAIE